MGHQPGIECCKKKASTVEGRIIHLFFFVNKIAANPDNANMLIITPNNRSISHSFSSSSNLLFILSLLLARVVTQLHILASISLLRDVVLHF